MPEMILRLLTLLALVAMPFGMNPAMAAQAHHATAAERGGPCDQHGQTSPKATQHSADCTISCAMLMVAETRIEDPAPAIGLPPARPVTERGSGLSPDTATPPPKPS